MQATLKKIYPSFLIAFRSTLPSIAGFAVSILVIRIYSKDLWGMCVEALLWINVMNHLASWGGKDYLLRKISQQQASLADIFWSVFSSKFILYILLSLFFLWFSSYQIGLRLLMLTIFFVKFLQGCMEPLIIYHKNFIVSLLSDMAFLLLNVAGILLLRDSLSVMSVLAVFLLSDLAKLLILVSCSDKGIYRKIYFMPDLNFFLAALPFFLLGLSGFLQSRADQFIVNYYLDNGEKATYQIYMNLLLFVFSFPHFFITPLLKNLYRSGTVVFNNIARTIMLSGLFIAPFFIIIIYFILSSGYHIDLSITDLLLGMLFVFPVFVFSIRIYHHFKEGKENMVVKISILCTVINVILCLMLVPELKITGALLSSAISQWIMMGIYIGIDKGDYFKKRVA